MAAELDAKAPEDLELAMNVSERLIVWRDRGETLPDFLLEFRDVGEAGS